MKDSRLNAFTNRKRAVGLLATVLIAYMAAFPTKNKAPFSPVPADQREALSTRLKDYVNAYNHRDWTMLYGLVSEAAKGGASREVFVEKMTAKHRDDFSSFPDLLEFTPNRTLADGKNEYDIYGCGKARREGREYNGIALVHAVFQHDTFYFSGWSFTEFPNEPCKLLNAPSWEPPDPMEWGQQMGELR